MAMKTCDCWYTKTGLLRRRCERCTETLEREQLRKHISTLVSSLPKKGRPYVEQEQFDSAREAIQKLLKKQRETVCSECGGTGEMLRGCGEDWELIPCERCEHRF